MAAVFTLPPLGIYSTILFMFDSNFISKIVNFYLFAALLIFVGQFPFLSFYFHKMSCGGHFISLGDKETAQLHSLLSVCALRGVETHPTDPEV